MTWLSRRLLTPSTSNLAERLLENVGIPSLSSRLFSNVPEAWGRPTTYTEGTDFLGTPKDHISLTEKRPKAPDVFEVGFKGLHYDFPIAAVSSVTNRITGAVLWGGQITLFCGSVNGETGATGVGCLSVIYDVGAIIDWAHAAMPLILYPVKFGISYCLIYHYLGGIRHFWFDFGNHGPTQVDKSSPLELKTVHQSSLVLFGASTFLALAFMIA